MDFIIGRTLAGLAAALFALAGCASVPRYSAAQDIHAFLLAVRDADRARFEAHLDRPALKLQLRSRLIAEAGRGEAWPGLASAGAALAAPLVDVAVDALVRPDVFRAQALRLGYDPARPVPGPLAIAALVRPLGAGRACVATERGGPCVFDFNDEGGVWRLTGYEGPLRPPPAPAHGPAHGAR